MHELTRQKQKKKKKAAIILLPPPPPAPFPASPTHADQATMLAGTVTAEMSACVH